MDDVGAAIGLGLQDACPLREQSNIFVSSLTSCARAPQGVQTNFPSPQNGRPRLCRNQCRTRPEGGTCAPPSLADQPGRHGFTNSGHRGGRPLPPLIIDEAGDEANDLFGRTPRTIEDGIGLARQVA
jgi:hypothetical protein